MSAKYREPLLNSIKLVPERERERGKERRRKALNLLHPQMHAVNWQREERNIESHYND